MKGIIGILMVIAVMYPPRTQARRIPVVTQWHIAMQANAETGGSSTASHAASPEEKARKAHEKAAKKAAHEAEKAKKKNKNKKSSALPAGAIASAKELWSKLDSCVSFSATVDYEVNLPMSSDDIVYTLRMASASVAGDPLYPCDYLIDWTLDYNGSRSDGFLAYFNGNHYRYRDYRLQEYHYEWDKTPFTTARGGVQANGQFVDLLPQSIGREMSSMMADSTYTIRFAADTIVGGSARVAFTAEQRVNGQTGRRYMIVADRFSGLPLMVCNEYNPGEVSEQSNTAKYSYSTHEAMQPATSEEQLQALYPEIFAKYRENGNRIEHMRGLPMPGFSLPTTTGERYTRQKNDPFRSAAVIAIIDPSASSAGQTVASLRKAIANAGGSAELIMAFTGSNTDEIDEIAGRAAENEHLLISARSLARDCGTEIFPTIIVVQPSGKVANVLLGVNQNMVSNVIESLAHAKSTF